MNPVLHHASTARLLGAAALAAAVLLQPARAAALRVALRPTAEVGAAHVTLGDIATVTGGDSERVVLVSSLEIGEVAADGMASEVDRVALARWVRTRIGGVMTQDITWSGAERCSVRRLADAAPLHSAVATAEAATAGVRVLVARGSTATLHAVDGSIEVESHVAVQEDGVAGQDVRVRLPGATADVLARVTGPGRVEMAR